MIALLYATGFVLNLLYGICGSIGMILAGLGGFAAFLALLDGSYAQAAASALVALLLCLFCSTDAAIAGRKCLDCHCSSIICLAVLKTEYDDEPLSAAQRFFFFR